MNSSGAEEVSHPTVEKQSPKNGSNQNKDNCDPISFITGSQSTMDAIRTDTIPHQSASCMDKVFSWRYAIVALLHASFMMATFARNCMPIALVCMTQTKFDTQGEENVSQTNGTPTHGAVQEMNYEFSWDSETQGLILSSGAFLSCLAPLLASFIQPYFGHKNTLTTLTLTSSLLLVLTPVAARASPWLLVAIRTLLGGTFGANVPVIGDSVARWAPKVEKQTMITIIYAGLQTGSTLCALLSGYLCLVPMDNGWPFIFYVIGTIVFLWVVFWHFLSSISPDDHPYIHEKELGYIRQHRVLKESDDAGKVDRPPYKAILTSVPVLAVLISYSLHYWSIILIFTYMPIYIATVLGFTATQTGVIMTFISLARLLGMIVATALVNRMMAQNKWSPTAVKKFNVGIGALLAAAGYVPAVLLDHGHRWVIIGCFVVSMLFQSVPSCILPAVPLDLAPRYAGFMTGLEFALGGLLGVTGPLITAALTPRNTAKEWQNVWIIASTAFVLISLVFTIFGNCNVQPWATDTHNKQTNQDGIARINPMCKYPDVNLKTSSTGEMDGRVAGHEMRTPTEVSFRVDNSGSKAKSECGNERLGGEELSSGLDGVSNHGFESDLSRPVPSSDDEKDEGKNNIVVVRF